MIALGFAFPDAVRSNNNMAFCMLTSSRFRVASAAHTDRGKRQATQNRAACGQGNLHRLLSRSYPGSREKGRGHSLRRGVGAIHSCSLGTRTEVSEHWYHE